MLLILDESGDSGLKLVPGQHHWLVVGAVHFATREDAEACRGALTELRADIGGEEFHSTGNNRDRRIAVLSRLAAVPMRYYAVACDKSRLTLTNFRKPTDLYSAVASRLVGLVRPCLADGDVWFDTLGGKDVDRQYGAWFRREAGRSEDGKPRVKGCKAKDSRREVLVQVADYVCGAVARSVRTFEPEREYRRLIRQREGQVLVWPPAAGVAGPRTESGLPGGSPLSDEPSA